MLKPEKSKFPSKYKKVKLKLKIIFAIKSVAKKFFNVAVTVWHRMFLYLCIMVDYFDLWYTLADAVNVSAITYMFLVPWQAYYFIVTAHFPLCSYSGKCACPNSRHMARTVPSLFGGVIVYCMSLRFKDFNFRYLFYFRLALYVYEYLLHVGAQKAAQTFLSEVSANFIFN